MARKLSALGHPVRLAILRQLSERDACCCKDIVGRLDLAQSTVSQHLKVLVDAGIVVYAPDRQRSRYSVDRRSLVQFARTFEAMLGRCCAESACGGGVED
ncbi:MAG: winged helix-turn-helix transcriptional regulator [Rhizobiaceae bacterium]|nr:winged helix-turn-helix transcriptional regulator [Rhizobiaceae bacterium]